MNEVDKIVDFINKEMDFYSYENFLENAAPLKRLYAAVDNRTKKLYRWYVYSRYIPYKQKNKIWEYLNNDIGIKQLADGTIEKLSKRGKQDIMDK